ncbi:MAG: hypothetical protein CMG23_05325 [Candidatus Marinimicrobia bacterium]|nr:hypothetical protein [Candidatus Neomarinimicrobiota bacterium]|tara:strand:- start:18579 stop:19049 length:471 start_codon:yes stop_codon:yes gene_type:complete
MNGKLKSILILFLLLTILPAQFRTDVQTGEIPNNLNGELESKHSISIFDSQRLDFSHGLSMSMVSNGTHLYSLTGLSSRVSYSALDNLMIDANVTLYKSQTPFQQHNKLIDQLNLGLDASITYKPTKNSFLQVRFQNLPYNQKYQNSSPFNMRFIQ